MLMSSHYKKVLIWSSWLRLSHAAIALATLVLLSSGWLIHNSPYLYQPAQMYHYIAAGIFVFGLLLRCVLFLTSSNHESLNGLLPTSQDLKAIKTMLRFYITLGKTPLPHWYAQNPFWKPLYLIIYLAMIIMAFSGAFMPEKTEIAGFFLSSIHQSGSQLIFWFVSLHIAAVILHDYKAQKNDISSIIHGYKLFTIQHSVASPETPVQKISIDSIKS